MRVLLDTNVVLDVLLRRKPWVESASVLWDATEDGRIEAFVTATGLTTISYLASKMGGAAFARRAVRECLDVLKVLAVDADVLEVAYELDGADFEDDVQVSAALAESLDAIVTRDAAGGFARSPIEVYSPAELAGLIQLGRRDS